MKPYEILNCGDEMIVERGTRESGIIDYSLGRRVTVSYRGGGRYLCGSCKGQGRYQTHDHLGCPHIQRVQRYREEHQEALNFIQADPALALPIAGG